MNDDKPKRYRRWALKTSRDIASGVVKVHPVAPAPKGLEPYAMRRARAGLVETLQIFDNQEKAKKTHQDKTFAAAICRVANVQHLQSRVKFTSLLIQIYPLFPFGAGSV